MKCFFNKMGFHVNKHGKEFKSGLQIGTQICDKCGCKGRGKSKYVKKEKKPKKTYDCERVNASITGLLIIAIHLQAGTRTVASDLSCTAFRMI